MLVVGDSLGWLWLPKEDAVAYHVMFLRTRSMEGVTLSQVNVRTATLELYGVLAAIGIEGDSRWARG